MKKLQLEEADRGRQKSSSRGNLKLGERVRTARKALGWTLHDLSSVTGLSRSHLSRIENGIANISLQALASLATALQRSLLWLIEPLNESER